MSNTLQRTRIGEIPLLQTVARRLGFDSLLRRYIKPHGNERYPAADTLLLLVFNIASGRQPLYELGRWTADIDGRLLGRKSSLSEEMFSDDRYGRALDKLFEVDRATLTTDCAVCVVRSAGCELDQLHNDSTTVKTTGRMPATSPTGLSFEYGHSKDHRPDLKQIVFNLTISADGAVPVHCKTYPGNRTDDTTHIETWKALCGIAGRRDFLYVADRKLCTSKQLSFIAGNGGRVVTIVPETWKEVKTFKESMRVSPKSRKRILRRPVANREGSFETFYSIGGKHETLKGGYGLHWIYSTQKRERDRSAREKRLEEAEMALADVSGRLNVRNLKTREQIQRRVEKILKEHDVAAFYDVAVEEARESSVKQAGRGRPGRGTRYVKRVKTVYSLSWRRNREALLRENNVDGVFPLLCTDRSMGAKEALLAYKYQPRLEKRFEQLKSVHLAAPTLFKKIARVEAMMMLFFMALIIQSVIEREVRRSMKAKRVEAIAVYPEHRLAYHPTTARIFDRFHDMSVYRVMRGDELEMEYRDELTPVHREVLDLLGMTEQDYWGSVVPQPRN